MSPDAQVLQRIQQQTGMLVSLTWPAAAGAAWLQQSVLPLQHPICSQLCLCLPAGNVTIAGSVSGINHINFNQGTCKLPVSAALKEGPHKPSKLHHEHVWCAESMFCSGKSPHMWPMPVGVIRQS